MVRFFELARSVTKWTQVCDRHVARVISYIHHTSEYRQYCHVGNTAHHCRLGLLQDSELAGDLEDAKSTSWGIFCIFWKLNILSVSWMCTKQTSLSHSSPESENISLDALRTDGFLALDLWDVVIEVLRSTKSTRTPNPASGNRCETEQFSNVDHIPTNTHSSQGESRLYISEDNKAVMKKIIEGRRSPTMRHVSRTHRVALDWLFDSINLDSKIQIKYGDTKNQHADMLTKESFTRDEWIFVC